MPIKLDGLHPIHNACNYPASLNNYLWGNKLNPGLVQSVTILLLFFLLLTSWLLCQSLFLATQFHVTSSSQNLVLGNK